MRILYHHRTRGEDAQGVHIRALCRAFQGLGHQVDVVAPAAPRRRGGPEAAAAPEGARSDPEAGPTLLGRPIHPLLYELLALAYNGPALLVLLARAAVRAPDLIYERYSLFTVAGLVAARLLRRPFVLEVNAPLSLELRSHGRLVLRRAAERIEGWLCRSATRTVVVSEAMAAIFTERGVPRERLMVVPNGVDDARFHEGVGGGAVRRRHGVEHARVIGFVGWVRPWHGVELLLRAAAPQLAAQRDVYLLIVGDGPALPEIARQAEALGVADRVILTGAVASEVIPEYIAALDIAVQPAATPYASPIKLFEYLALGRAVVAPDQGNIREVVRDGVSAALFEPGDEQALRLRLEALLDDPQSRRDLGAAGARLVRERGYTWRGNAQRVLEVVGEGGEAPGAVRP